MFPCNKPVLVRVAERAASSAPSPTRTSSRSPVSRPPARGVEPLSNAARAVCDLAAWRLAVKDFRSSHLRHPCGLRGWQERDAGGRRAAHGAARRGGGGGGARGGSPAGRRAAGGQRLAHGAGAAWMGPPGQPGWEVEASRRELCGFGPPCPLQASPSKAEPGVGTCACALRSPRRATHPLPPTSRLRYASAAAAAAAAPPI
jgi:hypothetical protein